MKKLLPFVLVVFGFVLISLPNGAHASVVPIFTDTFTRAASSTVGNGWIDPSSNFSISNNTLVNTASNHMLLRPQSEAVQSTQVSLTVVAGSRGYVIVGTNYNGSNGYGGVLDVDDSILRIWTIPSNFGVADIATPVAFTPMPGTGYIITLTSLSNGSSSNLTFTVAATSSPNTILATATASDSNPSYQNIGQDFIINNNAGNPIAGFSSAQIISPLTPGSASITSRTTNSATITATAPTGGISPYTYRWDVGTTPNFATSSGTLISGQTSLALTVAPPSSPGQFNFYRQTVTSTDGQSTTTLNTVGVGANQPFIYDRPLVITHNHLGVNAGVSGTSATANTFQQAYLVSANISDLRVNFANTFSYYGGSSIQQGEYSTAYNNEITIQASALVLNASGNLVGSPTQLTFNNGQTSVTLPYTSGISTDPLTFPVTAGQTLLIRTYVVVPTGGQWPQIDQSTIINSNTNLTTGATNNTSNSILSLVADFSPQFGQFIYSPVGVYGTVTGASATNGFATHGMIQLGDSIQEGLSYGAQAATAAGLPFLNLGRAGELADTFAGIGGQVRQAIVDGSPILFDEYGVNDIRGSVTFLQLKADQLSIWTKFAQAGGKRLITTTITPLSTSSGDWSTTGAQTGAFSVADRASYNNYLRNGGAATDAQALGLEYYNIDTAAAVEAGSNTSIWANNSGTAITDDGVHPNTLGVTRILAAQQANIVAAISAPFISSISSGSPTLTGATITWTTDENANSRVVYGPSSSYGSLSALNTATSTSHSVALSGLSSGNTYHFAVVSTNPSGFTSTSSDQVFTVAVIAGSLGGGGASYVPMYSFGTAPATSTTSVTATTTPIVAGCQTGFLFSITTGQSCSSSTVTTGQGTTPTTHYMFNKNLSYHQTGSEVLQLQLYLQSQGLFTATPNSIFGPLTLTTLIKFQKLHSISPASGYFGPLTRSYVNSH